MAEHFSLRLKRAHMLAPSVRHLAFERVDGAELAYIPGQFLQVHFHYDDGKATKRSYSVATVAGDPQNSEGLIEIAVSYVDGGAATKLLSALQAGDEIAASGPYGRFCLQDADTNTRYLLIATGTGVTPYRAMLPRLRELAQTRGVEALLLYGARNAGELLYGDEFEAFAAEVPQFRFVPCLSREMRTPVRGNERSGYVQQALAEFTPNPTSDIAYLCGNPNMVDACFEALKGFDLPIPHIRREKYVSSK